METSECVFGEESVVPSQEQSVDNEEEWEEVGPKNKSSVTRSV